MAGGVGGCGFVWVCDMSTISDHGRMYKLYTRVDGGLLCLMKCMSAHLRETGERSEGAGPEMIGGEETGGERKEGDELFVFHRT